MPRPSIDQFITSDAGAAFYRAYDSVLAKWPNGTTARELDSVYGTTYINEYGPDDGPAVLLLPGAGATSTVWFNTAAALGTSNRLYAIDLMGDAGRSVGHGRPIASVDDLLDWLRGVVDALELDSFSIVAHSYGAMIALAYALRAEGRVKRLFLLDPNSCFAGMRAAYLARAVPILLRPNERRERSFIRWETDGLALDEDWLSLLAQGAAHFPKSKTIVPERPSKSALAGLAADTTVILAGRSKVHDSRKVEAAVRSTLPTARTVILDSATHHALPMTPTIELNAALVEGLTGMSD